MRRAVRAACLIAALSCTPALAQNHAPGEIQGVVGLCRDRARPRSASRVAQPNNSTPKNIKRGPIFFYISRWPADNVPNEISVKMGYPFAEGAKVTATVGSAKFELFTKEEGAFVEKPETETSIIDGDEDRQHDEDRGQVAARHRHQRRLFARRAVRGARPHRQGMQRLSFRKSCRAQFLSLTANRTSVASASGRRRQTSRRSMKIFTATTLAAAAAICAATPALAAESIDVSELSCKQFTGLRRRQQGHSS